jgi:hypothetical protein
MSIEVKKQALEALDMACAKYGNVGNIHTDWGKWDAAATALRQAIIEAGQNEALNKMPTKLFGPSLVQILNDAGFYRKREWQDLTDDNIDDAWRSLAILSNKGLQELRREYARAIEAKLKEKNDERIRS